jgi:hypothetical protein
VHGGLGVVFEDDEVGADAVEEPAVMGDERHFTKILILNII